MARGAPPLRAKTLRSSVDSRAHLRTAAGCDTTRPRSNARGRGRANRARGNKKSYSYMRLELTPEQIAFRQSVEQFARGIVAPRAAGIDATGQYPLDVMRAAGAR